MNAPLRLLAPALVLGMLASCDHDTGEEADGERSVPVAAYAVNERDLSRELRISAPVAAEGHIHVAARMDGTAQEVRVREGDEVAAGEVLLKLDDREARAELERAEAEAEAASLALRRARDLHERGLSSDEERDAARTRARRAEAERALWATRLDFTELRAPTTATVSARHIEAGEAVSQGDTLFELVTLGSLLLRPGVSERDALRLAPGQAARLRFDALPGERFTAEIARIFPAADTTSRLVTIEIALPEAARDAGVRPGFLARATLRVGEARAALAVPSSALGEDADGHYVLAIVDGRLERRDVATGVTRGDWTQIETGLKPGEEILASNPAELQVGQSVRIVGRRG